MSIENWIQILVPVVGIIIAVISASLSYFFAKRRQLRATENRLKEWCYLDYMKALSDSEQSAVDLERNLSDERNHIFLVGSSDTVTKLVRFSTYMSKEEKQNFTMAERDMLLTELVKSMRADLYKSKRVNKNYPTISLSGNRSSHSSK